MSDELDRMSRIVTDLLVLARAEQPDFVRVADCDVAALTLDIEAKAQNLGDRRWQLRKWRKAQRLSTRSGSPRPCCNSRRTRCRSRSRVTAS
ncbi:hypothetical protein JM654_22180 [Microbacterium oxydans]|nr:hypothetical protein [Microbacterium oxydans]